MNAINVDLSEIQQLQQQIEELQRKMREAQEEKKHAVIKEMRELIRAFDITPRELGFTVFEGGARRARGMSTVKPKYANPMNPSETWSGRGRTPAWVKELLDQGYTMDDLLIKTNLQ